MPADRRPGSGSPGLKRHRFGARSRAPDDPTSVSAARGRAVGLLSRRDLPRRALKGRLTEAGFEVDTAEVAVAELEDERLVNDARYVEAAVTSRSGRGQGPLRIALELRRLGVAGELLTAAIDSRSPHWADQATALRERRFGLAAPRDAKDGARQARFLLSRGFTGDQVRTALGRRAAEPLEELEAGEVADADGDEDDATG